MTTRRWITAAAMALATLAVSTKASVAQSGYRDRDQHRDQHRDDRNRWNHRFDDHDRRMTRGWFERNRRHPPRGLRRQDRLPPALNSQFRVGIVLVPALRGRMYAVPGGLYTQLPPVPFGFRYVLIGGRIVVIDPSYRVVDMMWIDLTY